MSNRPPTPDPQRGDVSTGSSVFHDQSGRRRRRFRLGVIAFVLLLVLAGAALAVTVLEVAPQEPLSFERERQSPAGPRSSGLAHRAGRPLDRASRLVTQLWRGKGAAANQPLSGSQGA